MRQSKEIGIKRGRETGKGSGRITAGGGEHVITYIWPRSLACRGVTTREVLEGGRKVGGGMREG